MVAREPDDAVLADRVREALNDDSAQVLIFVYRRASAESLATRLAATLETERYGGVSAYHAGMTLEQRERIRQDFETGGLRCCVTTSALALGINLPATHVFVRDLTFHGSGTLGVNEVLQMLGRAGRGGTAGTGAVLVRATDAWSAERLARALRDEHLEPLASAIRTSPRDRRTAGAGKAASSVPILDIVAAALARSGENGETLGSLRGLLGRTLSATELVARAEEALASLEDPANALAYKDADGRYRLTVLGRRGVRTLLPLPVIAGMGQLIRDLLTVDPQDGLLAVWQPLDHLILVALLSDRTPISRRYSTALADQIEGWIERQPSGGKSLLFRRWIFGRGADAGPAELLGSLGLALSLDGDRARRLAYRATFSAILLAERSRGTSTADLQRQWELPRSDGLEDSWRDTVIWMLLSIARLYELRCFYHHLLERCDADHQRVKRVKTALCHMRRQAYDLTEDLRYCSPLGALLRNARAPIQHSDRLAVGAGTVRRLEAAGVRSIQQVVGLGLDGLIRAGVHRSFAKQLLTAARARSL
jgi:ATP-dependent DNA helicase